MCHNELLLPMIDTADVLLQKTPSVVAKQYSTYVSTSQTNSSNLLKKKKNLPNLLIKIYTRLRATNREKTYELRFHFHPAADKEKKNKKGDT